jgi:hypothetical protein
LWFDSFALCVGNLAKGRPHPPWRQCSFGHVTPSIRR